MAGMTVICSNCKQTLVIPNNLGEECLTCSSCGRQITIALPLQDGAPDSTKTQGANESIKKTKKCKHCGKEILIRASKCKYCGSSATRKSAGSSKVRKKNSSFAWIVLFVLVGAFLYWFFQHSTPLDKPDETDSDKKISPTVNAPNQTTFIEPEIKVVPFEAPAIVLPKFERLAEPDWKARQKYWDEKYRSAKRVPAIGKKVSVGRVSRKSVDGILVKLESDHVVVKTGEMERGVQKSHMDKKTQRAIYPDDFLDQYVQAHLGKELKAYSNKLRISYDAFLYELNMVEATLISKQRSYGIDLSGKVAQVLGDDVLFNAERYDEPVLIEGIGSKMVDGQRWQGMV